MVKAEALFQTGIKSAVRTELPTRDQEVSVMEGSLRSAVDTLKRRAKGSSRSPWARPRSRKKFGHSAYDEGVRIATAAAQEYEKRLKKIK